MYTKTPNSFGGPLQAVSPVANPDGAVLAVTGTSSTTTNVIGSESVILFSNTHIHVKLSSTGPATTLNYIVPAMSERVLLCAPTDKIHAIKMTGAADGSLWWWPCDYTA